MKHLRYGEFPTVKVCKESFLQTHQIFKKLKLIAKVYLSELACIFFVSVLEKKQQKLRRREALIIAVKLE